MEHFPYLNSKATKHKNHKHIPISKVQTDFIMNKHKMKAMKQFTNQVESNNNSPLQQGTPKQMQNKLAFPPEGKAQTPYCIEPVNSQMSILFSNCQVLRQLVPLQRILKGRSSGKVGLAVARA